MNYNFKTWQLYKQAKTFCLVAVFYCFLTWPFIVRPRRCRGCGKSRRNLRLGPFRRRFRRARHRGNATNKARVFCLRRQKLRSIFVTNLLATESQPSRGGRCRARGRRAKRRVWLFGARDGGRGAGRICNLGRRSSCRGRARRLGRVRVPNARWAIGSVSKLIFFQYYLPLPKKI